MNEELLKIINDILHTEFNMKDYKDSPDVLREVLNLNREKLIDEIKQFSMEAWSEDNLDLLVDKIKEMTEDEAKKLNSLKWCRGLENNQLFMKKCLNEDLNINYNFIVNSELIDDESLDMFINGNKEIPNYTNEFFYKAENIERMFKYGEEGLKYISRFRSSLITDHILEQMLEYGEVALKYIYNFPLDSWTEENIEKLVNILKSNSNLNLNNPYRVPLRNNKLLLKRCIEEDLNYDFFKNDEIYDSEIVQLIIDKNKTIPSYVNGFFYKDKNFKMILGLDRGIGFLRHFIDTLFTEENINLYTQAIRENGIEYKYNPNSMLYWTYFPKSVTDNRGFDKVIDACLDSKSVTVFRDFSDKALWNDERIDKVVRNY